MIVRRRRDGRFSRELGFAADDVLKETAMLKRVEGQLLFFGRVCVLVMWVLFGAGISSFRERRNVPIVLLVERVAHLPFHVHSDLHSH